MSDIGREVAQDEKQHSAWAMHQSGWGAIGNNGLNVQAMNKSGRWCIPRLF